MTLKFARHCSLSSQLGLGVQSEQEKTVAVTCWIILFAFYQLSCFLLIQNVFWEIFFRIKSFYKSVYFHLDWRICLLTQRLTPILCFSCTCPSLPHTDMYKPCHEKWTQTFLMYLWMREWQSHGSIVITK